MNESILFSLSMMVERNKLLEEMEDAYDNKRVEYFKALLKHEDYTIRARAVCILVDLAGDDVVDDIAEVLLHDPNALVRHEAAYSLGQLGYAKAVDALIYAMLNDPNPFVRHESAIALGVIGSERAREALIKALNDERIEVRESAVIALANLDYLAYSKSKSRFTRMTGG